MTATDRASRRPSREAGPVSARPGDLLSPLNAGRTLSVELIDRLSRDILDGTLQPGARLPTEQQLGAALGVSRTVVREALAALKRDGLVVPRQGAGVFVADHDQRRPFRIDPDALSSVNKVLDLMELRTGLESEAAGLAALRRTEEDLRALDRALLAIDAAQQAGLDAAPADFDFHRAIMLATHNTYFAEFLRFLSQFIVPRHSVRAMAVPPGRPRGQPASGAGRTPPDPGRHRGAGRGGGPRGGATASAEQPGALRQAARQAAPPRELIGGEAAATRDPGPGRGVRTSAACGHGRSGG